MKYKNAIKQKCKNSLRASKIKCHKIKNLIRNTPLKLHNIHQRRDILRVPSNMQDGDF